MACSSEDVRRAVEHDCVMLMQRYAVTADRDITALADLFAEDGVWVRPGMEMRSPAEMREAMGGVAAGILAGNPHGHVTRHMFTTCLVEADDDDHAHGTFYAQVFRDETFDGTMPRPMNSPELIVEYNTAFRRTGQGWRIARHEAKFAFRR